MKSSKHSGMFRPFEGLHRLLKNRSLPPHPDWQSKAGHEPKTRVGCDNDRELFAKAMVGVQPMPTNKGGEKIVAIAKGRRPNEKKTECDTLSRLNKLIEHGQGFVVADTPEYIEGVGYRVHPAATKYLHRGNFSIQAHIDLHGLSAQTAEEVFNRFLREALVSGKRVVLIVHGRGLSSPDRPILKTKVHQWLTTAPWHKWVLAYSSARLCDGGAGATYVLLRQRPLTKRHKKNTQRWS